MITISPSRKSILVTNEFATNREPDEHIENMEEGIYASDQLIESIEGSTQYQFELNKLVKLFPFSPHCMTPDSDDEPKEYTIDQLSLLNRLRKRTGSP